MKSINSMAFKKQLIADRDKLHAWYQQSFRKLPWRMTNDPYKVWISEIMLQQTTVIAVIPYYTKFINSFPNVQKLATANESEVLEHWTGLGYYSRARNIFKASKILADSGFPKSHDELIKLPGFGPYTSRAVSSFCFKEKVGVLDGNVIRILTRRFGLKLKWWETNSRDLLQNISDLFAQCDKPDLTNQALMELGATICTPQKPSCIQCPWVKNCVAYQQENTENLPLKKIRPQKQMLLWTPHLSIKNGKVALAMNDYTPFLKKQLIFPGEVKVVKDKPKKYSFIHQITKYQIFVKIEKNKNRKLNEPKLEWIQLNHLQKVNPSSLLKKTLEKMSAHEI